MSKKLIEVALPLEAINTAAAHEKMRIPEDCIYGGRAVRLLQHEL